MSNQMPPDLKARWCEALTAEVRSDLSWEYPHQVWMGGCLITSFEEKQCAIDAAHNINTTIKAIADRIEAEL